MSNGNKATTNTEKFQSRAKMLEKLMEQIEDQQENKETNQNHKIITSNN
jgi:proteasome assembly chaperone (PAC2) family protein